MDYKTILHHAPMAYACCTLVRNDAGRTVDYRYDDVNGAFEFMTGLLGSEIIGKTAAETRGFLDPDFDVFGFYHSVAASGKYRREVQRSRTGSTWYQIIAYPFQDDTFVTLFCDITEEVMQQEKQVQLISSTNDVIIEFDEENRICEVYTQLDPDAFNAVGKRMEEIFPPEFSDEINTVVSRVRDFQNREIMTFPSPFPGDQRFFRAEIRAWNSRVLLVLNDMTKEYLDQLKINELTENLEEFFARTRDLMCITDQNGCFVKVNGAWESMLGFTPQQVEGTCLSNYLHPEEKPQYKKKFTQILDGTRQKSLVMQFLCADGSYRTIEWNSGSTGTQVFAVGRDITDTLKLRRELERERDFSKTVLDAVPEAVAVSDAEGEIRHVNQAFLSATGKDAGEILGRQLDEFTNAAVQNGSKPAKALLESQEGKNIQVYAASAPLYRTDYSGGTVTVFTDISEITRYQQKLERQAEFERLLLDLSSDLFSCSKDTLDQALDAVIENLGMFTASDRAYLFRYDEGRTSVSNTHEWCAPYVEPQLYRLQNLPFSTVPELMKELSAGKEVYIQHVAELGDDWSVTREHLLEQGIHSMLLIPVADGKNSFGFIGFESVHEEMHWRQDESSLLVNFSQTIAEVLSRLQREQDLNESLEREQKYSLELNRINREISGFVAKMSHEVRTAVNAVTWVNQMLMETDLDETQARYAGIIASSSTMLLNLVRDVLDFSRIESGKVEIQKSRFSLRKTMEECINTFTSMAEEKALKLSLQWSPSVPAVVTGDSAHVSQIAGNLVSNAVKYTQEGEVAAGARIVEFGKQGVQVEIWVRDTGPGIALKDQEHIFDPYYQVEAVQTEEYSGTGLGLAICRRLAQQMGGTLTMESAPGKGTLMRAVLPFDLSSPEESLYIPCSGELKGLQCGVYEPDGQAALSLADLMRSWGMEVIRLPDAYAVPSDQDQLDVLMVNIQGLSPDQFPDPGKGLLYLTADHYDEALFQAWEKMVPIMGFFLKPLDQGHVLDTMLNDVRIMGPGTSREVKEELSGSGPIRVLVAEDMMINQEVVEHLLAKAGIPCDIADRGLRAVEMASTGDYDLILMDLKMPDISGMEAARRIRGLSDRKRSSVPIVALTANVLKGEEERCRDAGMNGFIVKPIQADQFYQTVCSFIASVSVDH